MDVFLELHTRVSRDVQTGPFIEQLFERLLGWSHQQIHQASELEEGTFWWGAN